ncbi:MAG: Na/Pi cotransporter family protein [Proteobacteria bacterium]|nr:Na/Pi cotransporter family protein [Pseudomonadota bacterium]
MINGLLLFITGLTLFLFGMIKLSSFIQQLFSVRMREYIKIAVKKPVYGVCMGILATILFQSSSATTMLTIGIVSAGLISFHNSLGIILGADIGTTLTAQLVVWNVTSAAPVIIFIGGILLFLGKEKLKQAGEGLIYFGLIFFGLSLTGDATSPLKESKAFFDFFHGVKNPLIGVGIGIIFTGIVHASAIPISILIIMGQQGLITIENAMPIVLGANIGTTVTALMGCLAGNINGKRSAVSHLVFKCSGVIICLFFLPVFIMFLKQLSFSIAQQIALGHFVFNLFIVLIFIFFLKPFSAFIEKIIPGTDGALPLWPEFLDTKRLTSAKDALFCVKQELIREIVLTRRMLKESVSLITKFSTATKRDIMYVEMVVDNLQAEITKYLWNISCGQLTPALSKKLFAFSTIVYEIERIGDRSTNIVELAESKRARKAIFSDAALEELEEIEGLVTENLEDTSSLLEKRDEETIEKIFQRHKEVETCIKRATEQHLERFYQKVCLAEAGPIFVDILLNLERISYHCKTIAEHMAGLEEET